MKYLIYCIKSSWLKSNIDFGILMMKINSLNDSEWKRWGNWTLKKLDEYFHHVKEGFTI